MSSSKESSSYFRPEFFAFLRDLAKNNNKPWFTQHKSTYETAVKAPSLQFVREMGAPLSRLSRHLVADARPVGGSMTRIYRDIRFSKDKSPYKSQVGIHFFHERMNDEEGGCPGFYLHLEPGTSMLAAGVWHPAPEAVKRIRDAIANDPGPWKKVRASVPMMGGESLKRVPPGYSPEDPFADDLRRRDFVGSIPLTDDAVTSSKFGATFLADCRRLNPLNQFVAKAAGMPW